MTHRFFDARLSRLHAHICVIDMCGMCIYVLLICVACDTVRLHTAVDAVLTYLCVIDICVMCIYASPHRTYDCHT